MRTLQPVHISSKAAKELGLPLPEAPGFLVLYEFRLAAAAAPAAAASGDDDDDDDDFDPATLPAGLRHALERYQDDRAEILARARAAEERLDAAQADLAQQRERYDREVARQDEQLAAALKTEADLRRLLAAANETIAAAATVPPAGAVAATGQPESPEASTETSAPAAAAALPEGQPGRPQLPPRAARKG